MAVKTGRLGWIGIGLESTPGVPVNPTQYLPFMESSMQGKEEILSDVAARGLRDQFGEGSQIGKAWGEGDIKVNLDPTLAPYFLGLAMGDFGTPVSEGGGVYTHTFNRLNSNAIKTASLIVDRVTDRQLFPYTIVNSAEINFDDGIAELSANLMSVFPSTSVSGTLTTASGTIFSYRQAQVQLGANVTAAASAPLLKLRSFSISINNNAEVQFVAGQNNVDSIIAKNFTVTGSFRVAFENTTQRDNFFNLAKQAMIVTFLGRGIGNGMFEYIKLRIYKIHYKDYTINTPIDDIITEDIQFEAEYSSTDSATMDVQVRNRVSSF